MSKRVIILVSALLLIIFVGVGVWAFSINREESEDEDKIKVAVSILPQVTFVERIGGDQVEVFELIPPGASPATYELVPSQLNDLSQTEVYFRIGHVPFEKSNVFRIEENNPDLRIVDTSEGIELLELEAHSHSEEKHGHSNDEGREGHSEEHSKLKEKCEEAGGVWLEDYKECEDIDSQSCIDIGGEYDSCSSACRHDEDAETCVLLCVEVCEFNVENNSHNEEYDHDNEEVGDDPHIWLDPTLVKVQGQIILDTLIEIRPDKEQYFQNNYDQFTTDLDQLDVDLTKTLELFRGETMLVYHPAFGYLANRYGFEQEHFEIPGRELSPTEVQEIVDEATEKSVRFVFVQQQFDTRNAQLIASEINGKVVQIDPLAKNYFENLRSLAQQIAASSES